MAEIYLSDCTSLFVILLAAFLFRQYYEQVRQPVDRNYGKKTLIDNYYLEWKRGEGVVNEKMGFGYVSCEDVVVDGTP